MSKKTDQEEWDKLQWNMKLLDMIEHYGDERARAAYHGPHNCRVPPGELLHAIQVMIEEA